MNNIETLKSALQGYQLEHGEWPLFILMSADVARAVFREVEADRNKYGSFVKIGGTLQPMKINVGPGIEIGQIQGGSRVALVADPTISKAMRGALR